MLGLTVLLAFLAYLAVSLGVIALAVRWAKKRNRKPWLWGGLAALVMYNLVFWDWIPTVVAHKYYCSTQAGFWVYKTPEEWKKENPGVVGTLTKAKVANWQHHKSGYLAVLNERFQTEVDNERPVPFLSTTIATEKIVDRKTKAILAKHVRVGSGYGSIGVASDWRAMKFWLSLTPCLAEQEQFSLFELSIINLGETE